MWCVWLRETLSLGPLGLKVGPKPSPSPLQGRVRPSDPKCQSLFEGRGLQDLAKLGQSFAKLQLPADYCRDPEKRLALSAW